MSKKLETVNIGDYLVAKDGKTKYIKLQCSPKADAATKELVEKLKALVGDVLYVNMFSAEFKGQYNIPDFAKGRISIPAPGASQSTNTDSEVDF